MQPNALELDGEDVEDVVVDVAAAYDLSLTDFTFPDFLSAKAMADHLWACMPEHARHGGKCGSSVAFYRLKAWLDRTYPQVDWRPTTRFAAVPGFRYDRLQREFAGWSLPGRSINPHTWLLTWLATAASGGVIWPLDEGAAIAAMIMVFPFLAVALHRWVFRTGRPDAATPGSVATHMAHNNLEHLRDAGVTLSRKSLQKIFETRCEMN